MVNVINLHKIEQQQISGHPNPSPHFPASLLGLFSLPLTPNPFSTLLYPHVWPKEDGALSSIFFRSGVSLFHHFYSRAVPGGFSKPSVRHRETTQVMKIAAFTTTACASSSKNYQPRTVDWPLPDPVLAFTSTTRHSDDGAWVHAPSLVAVLWFSRWRSVDRWSRRRKEEGGNRKSPSLAARDIHAPPLRGDSDGYVSDLKFLCPFLPFSLILFYLRLVWLWLGQGPKPEPQRLRDAVKVM